MDVRVIPREQMGRDLRVEACDEHGRLKVMPSAFYAGTTQAERSLLALQTGSYVLPTHELVAWLRERINGRRAIEIGSGNGVLAAALGIPATDNRMQEQPEISAYYASLGQPVVPYGEGVEKFDALEAIERYRPQVVVAAWVTHIYDPARHDAGGNMFGIDEDKVLDACEEYLFVGNQQVHAGKRIWREIHEQFDVPGLYSRASNGTPDFVVSWQGRARA